MGVDPGITGGLAIIGDGHLMDVIDMPCLDGEASGRLIADYMTAWNPDVVVIEHVQPMPKNGSIASFSLGKNYGIVCGVATAMRHPLVKIRPMEWKKSQGLLKKPKAASRGLAMELWPNDADKFKRVKDDGRAEAALIARAYGFKAIAQANAS